MPVRAASDEPGRNNLNTQLFLPLIKNGPTTDSLKPTQPTGLSAVASLAINSVTLNWNASTDNVAVAGYAIYRDGALLTYAGAGTTYADLTVNPTTDYSYYVRAFDAAGNSSNPSTTANVRTPVPFDATPPSVPANLAALPTGPTTVVLSWDPASDNFGVTAYDIYRNDGFTMTVGTVTNTLDSTVITDTAYSYQIRARDGAGNISALSSAVNVATPPTDDNTPPSAPSGLASVVVTSTAVTITWNAATDDVAVTGYDVLRDGALIATVPAPPFMDSPIAPNTSYTYVVKARDAGANVSGPSNILTVNTPEKIDSTPPSTPTGVTATVALNTTPVNVVWTASTDDTGVAGYDVFRNGLFLMSVLTVTSAADLTARAATTYSYTVRAHDASGNSSGLSTPPAVITTPAPLFSDGFESGNFLTWTTTGGMFITDTGAHAGAKAAEGVTISNTMFAKKAFPVSYSNAYARAYFNVISNTSQMTLLGFRTIADAQIGYLLLTTGGKLHFRNEVEHTQVSGLTANLAGTGWHSIELHMNITGAGFSTVEVWLDGVPLGTLALTGNLGATPIGKVQIGDVQAGNYHAVFDDVAFDTRRIGP